MHVMLSKYLERASCWKHLSLASSSHSAQNKRIDVGQMSFATCSSWVHMRFTTCKSPNFHCGQILVVSNCTLSQDSFCCRTVFCTVTIEICKNPLFVTKKICATNQKQGLESGAAALYCGTSQWHHKASWTRSNLQVSDLQGQKYVVVGLITLGNLWIKRPFHVRESTTLQMRVFSKCEMSCGRPCCAWPTKLVSSLSCPARQLCQRCNAV